MATQREDTTTWPELAAGLYDQLTGRGSEINYQFDDLEITVPSRAGADAAYANWKLKGGIRIRTADNNNR